MFFGFALKANNDDSWTDWREGRGLKKENETEAQGRALLSDNRIVDVLNITG